MAEELRLILMRHAKSSWSSEALSDHARPLNKRGQRDAPRIGKALAERGWSPELVISSDSERTRQTYALMEPALSKRPALRFERSLYHAGTEEVRAALREVSSGFHVLLLLGHNEGWEQALSWLTGREERLTTANAALMRIEAKGWAETVEAPGRWSLETVLRPKELQEPG